MPDHDQRVRRIFGFVRRLLIAAVSAVIFWMIILMLFENKFIFFPSVYPSGPYEDIRAIPNGSEHSFETEDGLTLHGVLAPAESAKVTIIFSHGNAGNLSHRIHWLLRMRSLHANIFMYDYRGYGRSEGEPGEDGVYADARAAYDHVKSLEGIGQLPIVLWGRSLGGAIAVDCATHRPAAALILESTFTSAPDVAADAYPFLPGIGMLMSTQLDSRSKMKKLRIPSLHIHGSDDSIIPQKLGTDLYEAAEGRKSLYIIEGAGHNDTYIVGSDQYLVHIESFLASLVGPT